MSRSETVKMNYRGKRIAISSFIQVFDFKIDVAIKETEVFLENESNKISIQKNLNLSLNLSAYYVMVGEYSKSIRILNFMSESDKYYQKDRKRMANKKKGNDSGYHSILIGQY